jgi:hypothetical protein
LEFTTMCEHRAKYDYENKDTKHIISKLESRQKTLCSLSLQSATTQTMKELILKQPSKCVPTS